ncbi:hypothetical protein FNZ23_28060, partial [Streptomyces benahoarensis]
MANESTGGSLARPGRREVAGLTMRAPGRTGPGRAGAGAERLGPAAARGEGRRRPADGPGRLGGTGPGRRGRASAGQGPYGRRGAGRAGRLAGVYT